MIKLNSFKKRQVEYYRNKWNGKKVSPKSIVESFFSTVALDKVVSLFPLKFKGEKVLIVCGGGDGFEIRKMKSLKAVLTVTDISPEALKEIKKNYPASRVKVADAENLPFKDDLFDIGLVKDGLHHLIRPEKGITELFRVCRKAVLIIDFQESIITKILKKLNFSPQYEEAGNLNFHFDRNNLKKLFSDIGANDYKITSFLLDARPFKSTIFNSKTGFFFTKLIFRMFNLFFSRWGNVLMVALIKQNSNGEK